MKEVSVKKQKNNVVSLDQKRKEKESQEMPKVPSVREGASYLMSLEKSPNWFRKDPIRLHVLCYLAECFYSSRNQDHLFRESPKAHTIGPYYDEVKEFLEEPDNFWSKQDTDTPALSTSEKEALRYASRVYGDHTGTGLAYLCQKDLPWIEANLQGEGVYIPRDSIRDYYSHHELPDVAPMTMMPPF